MGNILFCWEDEINYLLNSCAFSPIYKLHSTVNIVGKTYTHGESLGNNGDLLSQSRGFNKKF